MRPMAQAFSEMLQFVTVDSREYPAMPRTLGIARTRGLSLQNAANGKVYPYGGETKPGEVQQFLLDISQGTVEPWDGHFNGKEEVHDEL